MRPLSSSWNMDSCHVLLDWLLRGSVVERQCEVVEQLLRGSVKLADVLTWFSV